MAKIIGIDLGTTNSCVAVLEISGSIIQNSEAWRVVLDFSARKVGPKV